MRCFFVLRQLRESGCLEITLESIGIATELTWNGRFLSSDNVHGDPKTGTAEIAPFKLPEGASNSHCVLALMRTIKALSTELALSKIA